MALRMMGFVTFGVVCTVTFAASTAKVWAVQRSCRACQ